MEKNVQVNLRLSKELVDDVDYIAQRLKVSRSDWLKVHLAQLIYGEIQGVKWDIYNNAEEEFVCGRISAKEFRARRGISPGARLKKRRAEYKKEQRRISENSRQYAKKFFDDAREEIRRKN